MKTILALLALIPCLAHAQLIDGFTGGQDVSVGPGTAGYSFTVGSQPLVIQSLGVFDVSGSGLSSSHEVGIWNASSQALVTSALIPATGATDINNFWYVNITPITLAANTTYRIGAQFSDGDADLARQEATITTINGATKGDAYLSTSTGFAFPDLNANQLNDGWFGPNANFSAVPEPAETTVATALLLLGLAAFKRYRSTVRS